MRPLLTIVVFASSLLAPATRAAPVLDPIGLPSTAAGGALAGGLLGGGVALSLAFAAQRATSDEVTPEARTLNQLATFGTLAAPALLSVVGAAVGGGVSSDLVGALTAGFGATVGAAVGTGVALLAVPLAPREGEQAGLASTAAVAGLVVGGATLGAAIAGVVAALTIDPAAVDNDDSDSDSDSTFAPAVRTEEAISNQPEAPVGDHARAPPLVDVNDAFTGPSADDASGSD